jgi:Xaa-Pro aminopeptidase
MVIENGTGVSKEEVNSRLQKTRILMEKEKIEFLIVIGRSFYDRMGSLAYLTNHFPPFPPGAFSPTVRGMGHGVLLLPLDSNPLLLVDHRNFREDMVHIDDVQVETNFSKAIIDYLEQGLQKKNGRVGIAGEDIMPATMYIDLKQNLDNVNFVNSNYIVEQLRSEKTPVEIKYLRKAAKITEFAYKSIFAAIKPGVRECDLCAEGHAAGMKAGADFVRYVRVHSGPWSSWGSRWPQATQRKIESGDLIRFDYVGAVEGYGFDVNRTFVVPGKKINAKISKMLELTVEVLRSAVSAVKPGIAVSDIHKKASEKLDEEIPEGSKYLFPMAGHGIGLETVENPIIRPDNDEKVKKNMVLCIEPQFVIPEVGGTNIEQMLLITDTGNEILTNTPVRTWE